MRKVMEIEKGLCYKLANAQGKKSSDSQSKIDQFEAGIQKCRDQLTELDKKLKRLVN